MQTTMDTWLVNLTELVDFAASRANLPARREVAPSFNGDEWVWIWRDFFGNDTIVADLRLRAQFAESEDLVHTIISAAVWPVAPSERKLSRAVSTHTRDVALEPLSHDDSQESKALNVELADHLALAWNRATSVAEEMAAPRSDTRESLPTSHPTPINASPNIEGMTVIELNALVKELEEKWGVSAVAPVAIGSDVDATAAADESEKEERKGFDVVLTDVGTNKIQVIKAVRLLTSLGPKEAKELVDSAPNAIKQGIAEKDARIASDRLREAGGTVVIKQEAS